MKKVSERAILILLAAVQFTHIMDFMIMMPLGPQLMRDLNIGPGKFSALVAAYTFSSGTLGLLFAPFIDRFDRRKLLLWAYAGFVVGTLACASAHRANTLLAARVICGAFGGVAGSVIMAIVSDVVPMQRRGAAMGILMTAFSLAAAFGVPFGLQIAQGFDWEAPFFLLAGMSALIWIFIFRMLPPLCEHHQPEVGSPFSAFWGLLSDKNAWTALFFMGLLVFGHFLIIPLLSPFLVSNVGLPERYLALVYLVGGVVTFFTAPRIGKLADRYGRLKILSGLVVVACIVTVSLANARSLSLGMILFLVAAFFVFASGRFVPGHAILSTAVMASRRGSFMSLVSCARDLASGLAASVGGWIVTRNVSGELSNFNWLGWIAVVVSLMALWLAHKVRTNETERISGA